MALLDFIKNRNASPQQSVAETTQQQKPETAKEMYSRQAVEDKANRVAPTPDQEARAQKIGEEMRSAMQPQERSSPAPSNAPGEGGTNAAQLQNQNHQGKAQESLSPTDDARGKTAAHERQPAPEKAAERPQTIARRPPSWER
jgi:hypothetical protein